MVTVPQALAGAPSPAATARSPTTASARDLPHQPRRLQQRAREGRQRLQRRVVVRRDQDRLSRRRPTRSASRPPTAPARPWSAPASTGESRHDLVTRWNEVRVQQTRERRCLPDLRRERRRHGPDAAHNGATTASSARTPPGLPTGPRSPSSARARRHLGDERRRQRSRGPHWRLEGYDFPYPSWSPDGTKIAFQRQGGIWTMNADGTNQTQLTDPRPRTRRRPRPHLVAGRTADRSSAAGSTMRSTQVSSS